jgi:hypothetical protein
MVQQDAIVETMSRNHFIVPHLDGGWCRQENRGESLA